MSDPIAPTLRAAREVAELREIHKPLASLRGGATRCDYNGELWPCDTATLLATVEAATSAARRETLDEVERTNPHQGDPCAPDYECMMEVAVRNAVRKVRATRAEPPRIAGTASREGSNGK